MGIIDLKAGHESAGVYRALEMQSRRIIRIALAAFGVILLAGVVLGYDAGVVGPGWTFIAVVGLCILTAWAIDDMS